MMHGVSAAKYVAKRFCAVNLRIEGGVAGAFEVAL